MKEMERKMDELTYKDISDVVQGNGWENWTLIVFNDNGQYNIFSLLNDECSMAVLQTVIEKMKTAIKEDESNIPIC